MKDRNSTIPLYTAKPTFDLFATDATLNEPELFFGLLDALREEVSLLEGRDDALRVDGVVDVEALDADGAASDAADHVTKFGHRGQQPGPEDPQVAVLDAEAELNGEEVALPESWKAVL